MSSVKPRIVARRTVYAGFNKLDIATVEAVDRSGAARRQEREVIDHGEASAVLIIESARDAAILVRQWRAPLIADGADPFLLEACAGIVDPGESPEAAARREAQEETGVEIDAIRAVGSILPSAGTLTERIHLFIADGRRAAPGNGGGRIEEGEDIEVVEVPVGELFDMAERGEIADAKTLILAQRLMIERGRR